MERKKHSRKGISLETKIDILDRLARGERSTAIGRYFSLGESTIRSIKKNEDAIRKSVISGTKLNAKLSRYSRNYLLEKMERALIIWIEELSQRRIPLSGYLMQRKARQFYEQLKESEPSTSGSQSEREFSASKGWLTRFLKRNALHNVKVTGADASVDGEAAKNFPKELAKIIEDGGYCSDQVFNADETGLFWKKMPSRTYIAKSEKKAGGFKAGKDRISLLLCSNASGDRMLKPLVVNRSLTPRALKGKDKKQLQVHWMASTMAWVTTPIFTDWFIHCFLPEVETYVEEKGLDFKILLLVGNIPGHPLLQHPNVKVIYFPSNTTSIIQPLDQGIIAAFKQNYVKRTFKFILDEIENEPIGVTDAWKKFSIFDCTNHIAFAIKQIKPETLNACWKNVWPACVKNSADIQTSELSDEIITLARDIGGEGFDSFGQNDIDELIEDNALSDNDIIGINLDTEEDVENDNGTEVESVLSTENMIREGFQLCKQLENHFLVNDTNSERAFKFQRELNNCMSEYRKLYKQLVKSSSQSLITESYIDDEKPLSHNETEVAVDAVVCVYSSDESDCTPVHKRTRMFSNSEDDYNMYDKS